MSNKKLNLLGWCDSPLSVTGFGVVAKNILNRIHNTGAFNVACIGINHLDEHAEKAFLDRANDVPYRVYIGQDIAQLGQGQYGVADPMGRQKLISMFTNQNVDAIFLMRDLWDMCVPQMPGQPAFSSYLPLHIQLAKERGRNFRVLAHFPLEHRVRPDWKPILDQIDYGYAFTDCYLDDLKPWSKNIKWAPQGADANIFKPLPPQGWGTALIAYPNTRTLAQEVIVNKKDFRIKKMRLPDPDAFVVINVNRNQPRKDIRSTLQAFAQLKQLTASSPRKVVLWLQMRPDDAFGDARRLCQEEGLIVDRDVFFPPYFNVGVGWSNEELNMLYNAADVFISTSVAEGMGLTCIEAGMAGCPVLVPGHTGFLQSMKHLGMPYVQIGPPEERPYIVQGSVVFPVNVGDMAEKLYHHYLHPEVLQQAISKNIKSFRYMFDWDTIFKSYWVPMLETLQKDLFGTEARQKSNKSRFLYVCEEAFGDILGATKAVDGLKQTYPDIPIDFMCKDRFANVVQNNPNIDKVIPWDINKIFDYPQIEDRPFLLGSNVFYPHARIRHGAWAFNPVHLLDMQAEMIGVPNGKPFIYQEPFDLMLDSHFQGKYNPETDDVLPIVTVHTTSQGGKMISAQKWTNLIANLINQFPHIKFVTVGGPNDMLLDPITTDFRFEPGTDKPLSYTKMAYLQSKAICHIGIDSGPAHSASVVNTPSVIFWGWTNVQTCKPQKYSINIVPHYVTVCPKMGPCHGVQPTCGINQYDTASAMQAPCVQSLSIDAALQLLTKALAKEPKEAKEFLKEQSKKMKIIYSTPSLPKKPEKEHNLIRIK